MRVLVTGHSGYIGSVMVPILRGAGHDIVGLDTFFFEDCLLGDAPGNVPAIRKDIRDMQVPDLEGCDAVLHLAALCNDPLGDLNQDWTYDVNHHASVHLARLSREAGVRRFLYASSCSMYGAAGSEILNETAPLRPLTAYAVSKVRTEEDVSKLADGTFSPVFMRNATAYGLSPHLRADVVLNNLVCWAHTTGRIRILSDGTPWRPIVHVQDISRAFAVALAAPRTAIHNEAFNVGSNEENYQVSELAEIVRGQGPLCRVAGCRGHTRRLPGPQVHPPYSDQASPRLRPARRLLALDPVRGVADGHLPLLSHAPRAHVRRPGHVAALRELSHSRAMQSHGALLSAARLCLRRVLPRSGRGIRPTGADLRRVRVFLVVLPGVARPREVLYGDDRRPPRPRSDEPGGRAWQQRRLSPAVLRGERRARSRRRAGRQCRGGRHGERRTHHHAPLWPRGRAHSTLRRRLPGSDRRKQCAGAGLRSERLCGRNEGTPEAGRCHHDGVPPPPPAHG